MAFQNRLVEIIDPFSALFYALLQSALAPELMRVRGLFPSPIFFL